MPYQNRIANFDHRTIAFFRRGRVPMSRIAIFVVYFWFGILKLLALSPAGPLILALLEQTMPWASPTLFLSLFGVGEMLIGAMFLVPRLDRVTLPLFALHMLTTAMPLVLLTDIFWTRPFVPTLEGQYIIKNLALIAVAMGMAGSMRPLQLQRMERLRQSTKG